MTLEEWRPMTSAWLWNAQYGRIAKPVCNRPNSQKRRFYDWNSSVHTVYSTPLEPESDLAVVHPRVYNNATGIRGKRLLAPHSELPQQ